mgnify:CR=1 FL=1
MFGVILDSVTVKQRIYNHPPGQGACRKWYGLRRLASGYAHRRFAVRVSARRHRASSGRSNPTWSAGLCIPRTAWAQEPNEVAPAIPRGAHLHAAVPVAPGPLTSRREAHVAKPIVKQVCGVIALQVYGGQWRNLLSDQKSKSSTGQKPKSEPSPGCAPK